MPEYFVSILNWPIEGDDLEDAARRAYRSLKEDPSGFILTVADQEGALCAFGQRAGKRFNFNPEGFLEKKDFDTYEFEESPTDD